LPLAFCLLPFAFCPLPFAYITGHPEACIALQHYFRNEKNWDTKHLKTKPFWK